LFTPRSLGPLLDVVRETDGELRARVEDGAQPHDVTTAEMGEDSAEARRADARPSGRRGL
jgi:hypothetical protein